jgi:hypothetical protein
LDGDEVFESQASSEEYTIETDRDNKVWLRWIINKIANSEMSNGKGVILKCDVR